MVNVPGSLTEDSTRLGFAAVAATAIVVAAVGQFMAELCSGWHLREFSGTM